jgi:hypothetical protein
MAWLAKRGLDGYRPARTSDDMWRVTFHGSVFDGAGMLPISKLGSFVVLGSDFFHVWCADTQVRRRGLLERADAYFSARRRIDSVIAGEQIAQIARQLEVGTIDLPALRAMAARAGKRDLAAQLARLIE